MSQAAENRRLHQIALLVSISCVLQISETMLPHPIPGLRLGLANMLVLIALFVLDFRAALEIAVFRTVVSSLIMGTFMSPTFILSFAGAVASTCVMGGLCRLSRYATRIRPGIIGISILGAVTHNMVQLFLAWALLVKHAGIFAFLPWLGFGALVTGWITGAVAAGVCRRLAGDREETGAEENAAYTGPLLSHFRPGDSFLHRLSPEIKIGTIFTLAVAVLAFSDFRFYIGLFFLLASVSVLSGIPVSLLFSRMRKFTFLLLCAFLFPLFFTPGTPVFPDSGHVKISFEGLEMGALCGTRILFLIWASTLMVATTRPSEMARGLSALLSPLRFPGFSGERAAAVFTLSCAAIPRIWERARGMLRSADLSKAKNLRNLIPLLCDLIATLYRESEPESRLWESAYVATEKRPATSTKASWKTDK